MTGSRAERTDLDALAARLRAAGCVFAEDEARVLLSSAVDAAHLEEMTRRRVAGEPLEQIVGWVEFDGLRLAVAPGVFVPRRRTTVLAEAAVAAAPAGGTVLDLCCGVGAVGAVVEQRRPDCTVVAADLDPAAVACARRNLQRGVTYEGDLYDALPADLQSRVDVIAANAPYVPSADIATMPSEARDHERRLALDGGPDGVDVHRRVASGARSWLRPGGVVLIETSTAQVPWTAEALARQGLGAHVADLDLEVGTAVVGGTAPVPDLEPDDLPVCELAFPGPVRDRLVAAVLEGAKTSTTSLVAELLAAPGGGEGVTEPMPAVGQRWRLVDSAGSAVCVIETTDVAVRRLAEVDLAHVVDEGEGDSTVAQWRAGHAAFWESEPMRDALGDPAYVTDDDTLVVLERFRVTGRL
ncbi:putative protein-(glutamine-N5) methyltransferase [Mumia flava]|uniref:ASCH domain-containing protein n=1 Tax=Mumia flava TaxID=1348852 RepID=A0A2M9BIN8_9ACTN|nr:putative protein N(5)-glutamine methyltransferase [Mumia flava]PJJ57782.1 putative protein-(glutamine-N5) methyltransferase [Mumia flava]